MRLRRGAIAAHGRVADGCDRERYDLLLELATDAAYAGRWTQVEDAASEATSLGRALGSPALVGRGGEHAEPLLRVDAPRHRGGDGGRRGRPAVGPGQRAGRRSRPPAADSSCRWPSSSTTFPRRRSNGGAGRHRPRPGAPRRRPGADLVGHPDRVDGELGSAPPRGTDGVGGGGPGRRAPGRRPRGRGRPAHHAGRRRAGAGPGGPVGGARRSGRRDRSTRTPALRDVHRALGAR